MPHTPSTLPDSVKHERLHALDALRALAMTLGVWLHMAMPYTEGIPPFFWAYDESDGPLVGLSVLLIHSWRMELFFMLSGFFTAMLVARRGVGATAVQRVKRILVPFVLAMLTLGTLCAVIWGAGWAKQYGGDPNEWIEGSVLANWGVGEFGQPGRLWHFWFLYTLITLTALALLARLLLARSLGPLARIASAAMGWATRSWLGVFVLAIPLGAMQVLLARPNGPDPALSLVPDLRSLSYYALPFFAGWFLYARRSSIDTLAKRFWWPLTIAGAIALPAHLISLTATMASMADTPESITPVMVAACMTRGLLTASMGMALIGLCTLALSRPGPRLAGVIRYFSDSAYWVYLAHMPLVAALSVWVFSRLDWWPMGEVVAGSLIAMTLLMGSYALFVRYTPIGTLLNGKRTRRRAGGAQTLTPASGPAAAGE